MGRIKAFYWVATFLVSATYAVEIKEADGIWQLAFGQQ
jgi:hypothetical protein